MRVARNQALFREVNERIWETVEEFGSHPAGDGLQLAFICECGNGECTDQLLASAEEYEGVRRDPMHRLVLPGHTRDGIDRVVDRRAGYLVVEGAPVTPPELEVDR
jgi:hypothetical protein